MEVLKKIERCKVQLDELRSRIEDVVKPEMRIDDSLETGIAQLWRYEG